MLRYRILVILFIFALGLSGQTTAEDRFGRLPEPPLNGQNRPTPKPEAGRIQTVPDPGAYPIAIFTSGETVFTGNFSGSVELSVQDRCINLRGQDNRIPELVCFALPDGMRLPNGNFEEVRASLSAFSGLEGANEHLYLAAPELRELALEYHFEVSDEPLGIEFSDLPKLNQQRRATNQSESNFMPVVTTIETDEGPRNLSVGQLERIQFGGVNYQVFLHTSVYQQDGGSCGEGGYILRVVILSDQRA